MATQKPKYSSFGQCLKALREKAKLTQAEAAAVAGIEEGLWAKIEAGTRSPKLMFLWKLAIAVDARPVDFLE